MSKRNYPYLFFKHRSKLEFFCVNKRIYLYPFVPICIQGIQDHSKTQEMCAKAARKDPEWLQHTIDPLKTWEMCSKGLGKYHRNLANVSDWFVRIKSVEMWYDDEGYWSNDEFTKLYRGCKNYKTLKDYR